MYLSSSAVFACSLYVLLFHHLAEAIRCYCTDEHCVPNGICEANVCLVGLLKVNSAVIRSCGNEPLGCQRNVDKWSDLCACDHSFCNSFAYLRANTYKERIRSNRDGGDDIFFQRVDPPLGDFSGYESPITHDDDSAPSQSSLLTLLLVIVPLSVGAATVLVVAFNYYCHLC